MDKTSLMMLLMLSLALLSVAVLILTLILQHRERQQWMRMISLREGIPLPSMAGSQKPEVVRVPLPRKHRFSVPLPGGDMFRRAK